MRRVAASILLLTVASSLAGAKDQPFQVVSWPDSGASLFSVLPFRSSRQYVGALTRAPVRSGVVEDPRHA